MARRATPLRPVVVVVVVVGVELVDEPDGLEELASCWRRWMTLLIEFTSDWY